MLDPQHLAALLDFALRLYWALRGYGDQDQVRVTSWFRTPAHNRAVGGHPESQHLLGLAIDIAGPQHALDELTRLLSAAGLVVVPSATHLHVQAFPAHAHVVRLRHGKPEFHPPM